MDLSSIEPGVHDVLRELHALSMRTPESVANQTQGSQLVCGYNVRVRVCRAPTHRCVIWKNAVNTNWVTEWCINGYGTYTHVGMVCGQNILYITCLQSIPLEGYQLFTHECFRQNCIFLGSLYLWKCMRIVLITITALCYPRVYFDVRLIEIASLDHLPQSARTPFRKKSPPHRIRMRNHFTNIYN